MKQRRAKPEKIRHDKRERIDRFKTSFFIAPSFIGAAIFFILPFFVVGYYALIDNPISQEFVGLQNFVNLFGNAAFRTAARNTAVFAAVAVPLAVVLPLCFALMLMRRLPLGSLFEPDFEGIAAFLASDAASFVTGSYHLVDGGYTAQ